MNILKYPLQGAALVAVRKQQMQKVRSNYLFVLKMKAATHFPLYHVTHPESGRIGKLRVWVREHKDTIIFVFVKDIVLLNSTL